MWKVHTEADSLSKDVNVDAKERCQARWEKQVEAGDPATDDGTLLEPLLRELPVCTMC